MNMNFVLLLIFAGIGGSLTADILMVTMGGTKSHKIPFLELAKGLIPRGHNITFLSGFPADYSDSRLHEITPAGLSEYIQNYTNWDLVGLRMDGKLPYSVWDVMRFAFESCDAMLNDAETKNLLNRHFELVILDGAFPECAVSLVHAFRAPFMMINTVGLYTGSLSLAGNPTPFSTTPIFFSSFTDEMNLYQRFLNTMYTLFAYSVHRVSMLLLQSVVRNHLGGDVPNVYDLTRNVSFILQNGHSSVSYSRPLLPNVAEIACIHCKPARPLPKELEEFVMGSGESGFIYVSMGSSVKAAKMPEHLRKLFIRTFAQIPYRVIWKYDGSVADMKDLPSNVKIGAWLPQQDLLGHRKLRAFVTHGGLLSMFESVYHGVPLVTMPVFCDHDVNAAKAVADGYALRLDLETLSSDKLIKGILKVIHDERYRQAVKKLQRFLLDQRTTPLDTAIYWTEYVLRHNGAYHLQSPSRNYSFVQYYLLDVVALFIAIVVITAYIVRRILRFEGNSKVINSLLKPVHMKVHMKQKMY
ncbi:UDP-glucosyltransferase 2 [Sitodiplosis mosellana]|uniref:UDP-glucosyltransferase 2 n=1 Tax=Sitodiplosis mosellana TaxID=263140 RepID=UPI002443A108|nr:UDP-glucosyltransferase 2 [Sitodiplosis mosellana]XP_055311034.1 UDP-glucosyltransferase 2 [Sitodiplosis mosellana]